MLKGAKPPYIIQYTPIQEESLFELPRSEYVGWNYPIMVLSIIKFHKTITYDKLATILQEHNVPTDLGYIFAAIDTLCSENKITKSRHTYTIK